MRGNPDPAVVVNPTWIPAFTGMTLQDSEDCNYTFDTRNPRVEGGVVAPFPGIASWPNGMAAASGAVDSRFESWRGSKHKYAKSLRCKA
jgi:hypothetical protein